MLCEPKTKSLRCPDCWIDMEFLVSQTTSRVFLSTLLERAFFVCPNCGRVSCEVVLWPKEFHPFRSGLNPH